MEWVQEKGTIFTFTFKVFSIYCDNFADNRNSNEC